LATSISRATFRSAGAVAHHSQDMRLLEDLARYTRDPQFYVPGPRRATAKFSKDFGRPSFEARRSRGSRLRMTGKRFARTRRRQEYGRQSISWLAV
jgi:hypothetical protein